MSHDWAEETPEAKARWFATLTPEERLSHAIWLNELYCRAHPNYQDQLDAEAIARGIRVLRLGTDDAALSGG